MIAGTVDPVYKFDHGVLHGEDVEVAAHQVVIGDQTVALDMASPYDDMLVD